MSFEFISLAVQPNFVSEIATSRSLNIKPIILSYRHLPVRAILAAKSAKSCHIKRKTTLTNKLGHTRNNKTPLQTQTHTYNTMSSLRDSRQLTRRESSPRPTARSSSRRRPQLLRSSATEPSITTSSAYRGVTASPNSSRRATEILSRVAVSNAAVLSSSPNSTRSFSSSDFESAGLTEAEKRELLRSNINPCKPYTNKSPMLTTYL